MHGSTELRIQLINLAFLVIHLASASDLSLWKLIILVLNQRLKSPYEIIVSIEFDRDSINFIHYRLGNL